MIGVMDVDKDFLDVDTALAVARRKRSYCPGDCICLRSSKDGVGTVSLLNFGFHELVYYTLSLYSEDAP